MLGPSRPTVLNLPLFLIACETISGEKWGAVLSSGLWDIMSTDKTSTDKMSNRHNV